MAAKNYSDTMIRAMLNALTHQDSDGRYQVLTRGRTLGALDARGAVESEEIRDNYGRPVTLWYLTPAAVTTLRNGLVLMMGGSTSDATKTHREFVRSGWREAEAAARLILGDITGAEAVTTAQGSRPHHQHYSANDAVSYLANALSNGQHVAECDTGIDGNEPAGRLVVHLGGAVGAETVFHIKRPVAEEDDRADRERTMSLIAERVGADYVQVSTVLASGLEARSDVDRAHALDVARGELACGADLSTSGPGYAVLKRRGRTTTLRALEGAEGSPVVDIPAEEPQPVADGDHMEEIRPQGRYIRYTGALGRGWARRVCEDNAASVREEIARARRAGRSPRGQDGSVIRVEDAGVVDPSFEHAGAPCPAWFVPVYSEEQHDRADAPAAVEVLADAYRVEVLADDGETVQGSREVDRAEARGIVEAAEGRATMTPEGVITAEAVPSYVGSATHRLTPLAVDAAEEATPIGEMGTDELLTVLREEAPGLPAGSRFARAWAAMDETLTAGGIECLPAPWDGYGETHVPEDADADTRANLTARFMPQDPQDENTRPCVGVGGAQVYVHRENGRLVVSVDLDEAKPEETNDDGTVPMVITVQGQEVFSG